MSETKPFHLIDYIKTQEDLDALLTATEDAAIELCAQEVEQFIAANPYTTARQIAAAIRALKDES